MDWNEGSNEETVKEFINEKMKIGAGVDKAHMIKVGGQEHNNSGDDEIDGGKDKDNEGEKQIRKGCIHRR